MTAKLTKEQIGKLEAYLRRTFGSKTLIVKPKIADMAEVYIGENFLGTVTLDDEDGDIAYQFQMAILDMDLEDV